MNTVIFIHKTRPPRCDLSKLKTQDSRFILLINRKILPQSTSSILEIFDEVVPMETLSKETLAPIIQSHKLSNNNVYILTTDELCVCLAAELRHQFNIPGQRLEEVLPFTDKTIMKKFLKNSNIRVPKHVKLESQLFKTNPENYITQLEEKLHYPMFVKPIDLHGAASAEKIISRNQLRKWLTSVQERQFQYEIDEYINGTLFHCDAIIQKGKVVYSTVFECTWPCAFFNEGYPLGSIQLLASNPNWTRLNNFNLEVLNILNPPDGATHLEAFKTPADEIIFLEIAARPVGAMVPVLHQQTTGINLELEHYKAQMGISSTIKERTGEYFSWAYLPKRPGIVKKLNVPSIRSKYTLTWFIKEDEQINHVQMTETDIAFSDAMIAGKLIWHNFDYKILYQDFEIIKNLDLIEYA